MGLKKREWAKRNHELSSKLLEENVYYDWSVTTAFYSAVHYVEDVIFPIKINGEVCNEIGSARRKCNMEGRHATREKLVYKVMGSKVGATYQWLDDMSRTARYKTYKTNKNVAVKAKEFLKRIEEECESFRSIKNENLEINI